jgi:hypothetical protein
VEKINLLVENIPHFTFNNHVIYDENIEFMTRGTIQYLSHGKDNLIFNKCDVHDFKLNKNKQYFFILSIHLLNWDILIDLLKCNNLFGNLLKSLLRAENVKCIFADMHESDDLNQLIELEKVLTDLQIDFESVWIFNNDSNLKEFGIRNNLKLQLEKINHLACTFPNSDFFKNFKFTEKKETNSFFICVNNKSKPHRVLLLSYLKKNNLLDKFNYSLLGSDDNNISEKQFLEILEKDEYDKINQEIKNILDNRPKLTNSENINNKDIINSGRYVYAGIVDLEDYLEPVINITTESHYTTNSVHITEKSFKPFSMCQLPIIVATPFHIKKMKEHYGFDFFDDVIDHSYDFELNHQKRLFMIIDEIKRLYNNKEFILEFYSKNKNRLEKNRIIIQNIQKENKDYKLLKKIIKWN